MYFEGRTIIRQDTKKGRPEGRPEVLLVLYYLPNCTRSEVKKLRPVVNN